MRDLLGAHLPSRVCGRAVLLRRLRGLLVATHRYGKHRAATHADQVWAARLIDGLFAALAVADPRDTRRDT